MIVPPFPVYLFDVDGTLVDPAADICGAVQDVLIANSRSDVSDVFLRRYIGRHLVDPFRELFPHYTAPQIDEMIAHYRRVYLAREHSMTQCYAGVVEMLLHYQRSWSSLQHEQLGNHQARLPGETPSPVSKGEGTNRRHTASQGRSSQSSC